MTIMRKHLYGFLTLAAVWFGSLGLLQAQQSTNSAQSSDQGNSPSQDQNTTAPDNTGTNRRDRNPSEPTADQQKENNSDRELARQVRRALVKDKSLSTAAHNIKVIAQNGSVTLKGPVNSEQEKQEVESKAAEAAGGADKINSEIEVKNKQASSKPSAGSK